MEPHSGAIVATGKVGVSPMKKMDRFAGLACDSRKVLPGYLFAALPGTRADGSEYIADAVRRGAIAVLGVPHVREAAEALGATFIPDTNPRLRLAKFAADYFDAQTGCDRCRDKRHQRQDIRFPSFWRQIWTALGRKAASMGTIGVVAPSGEFKLEHTTPDPVALHQLLAQLKDEGVEHLALEASSHGLDQYRLDGVRVGAAAFTNITRDHLDYHADFASYLAAKLRLFKDILDRR